MTFKERLPYFLVGLFIGIILVIFFLGKKNTNFDYGPNARVLKNIRLKNRIYSEKATQLIDAKTIDTITINNILKTGSVDMWNKVKKDTCTQYNITGTKEFKNIQLTVKNCDSTAIIENIIIE